MSDFTRDMTRSEVDAHIDAFLEFEMFSRYVTREHKDLSLVKIAEKCGMPKVRDAMKISRDALSKVEEVREEAIDTLNEMSKPKPWESLEYMSHSGEHEENPRGWDDGEEEEF